MLQHRRHRAVLEEHPQSEDLAASRILLYWLLDGKLRNLVSNEVPNGQSFSEEANAKVEERVCRDSSGFSVPVLMRLLSRPLATM